MCKYTCIHICMYIYYIYVAYIHQYELMDISFILWILFQYNFIFCSNCFSFDHWKLSVGSHITLIYAHPSFGGGDTVFSIFLLSGTTGCFIPILYISCTRPRSHFSAKLWFLTLESSVRTQGLGLAAPRCRCFWTLSAELARTCVWILACVCTHIYACFYICPSLY